MGKTPRGHTAPLPLLCVLSFEAAERRPGPPLCGIIQRCTRVHEYRKDELAGGVSNDTYRINKLLPSVGIIQRTGCKRVRGYHEHRYPGVSQHCPNTVSNLQFPALHASFLCFITRDSEARR